MTNPSQEVSTSVILRAMDFDCPICGAKRGELCREKGEEVAGVHVERSLERKEG